MQLQTKNLKHDIPFIDDNDAKRSVAAASNPEVKRAKKRKLETSASALSANSPAKRSLSFSIGNMINDEQRVPSLTGATSVFPQLPPLAAFPEDTHVFSNIMKRMAEKYNRIDESES